MTHVRQSANNKFTDDKFDAALNSINAKPIADEEILDAEYEVIKEPNPNDKRKKAAKILSGIAIGAGLVGGTLAYIFKGNEGKNVNQPTTTAGETVNSNSNSNETTTNNETETITGYGNYVISPELSDEQVAQKFISNLDSMLTVCMTEEVYKEYVVVGTNEWETEKVTPYVDKAFTDMFGEDYASDPEIKTFYDTMLLAAVKQLHNYFITVNRSKPIPNYTNGSDKPLYEYSLTMNSATENNGQIRIETTSASNFYDTVLAENSSATAETNPEDTNIVFTIDTERTDSAVIITSVVMSYE